MSSKEEEWTTVASGGKHASKSNVKSSKAPSLTSILTNVRNDSISFENQAAPLRQRRCLTLFNTIMQRVIELANSGFMGKSLEMLVKSHPSFKPSVRSSDDSDSDPEVSCPQSSSSSPAAMLAAIATAAEAKSAWVTLIRSIISDYTLPTSINRLTALSCLGVGPFHKSVMAQYQLAFFLITAAAFPSQTKPEVYDPVHNSHERAVLEDWFGLAIPSRNDEGRRNMFPSRSSTSTSTSTSSSSSSTTTSSPSSSSLLPSIVFLPHCGIGLSNNVLWANWGPQLTDLIIIANTFSYTIAAVRTASSTNNLALAGLVSVKNTLSTTTTTTTSSTTSPSLSMSTSSPVSSSSPSSPATSSSSSSSSPSSPATSTMAECTKVLATKSSNPIYQASLSYAGTLAHVNVNDKDAATSANSTNANSTNANSTNTNSTNTNSTNTNSTNTNSTNTNSSNSDSRGSEDDDRFSTTSQAWVCLARAIPFTKEAPLPDTLFTAAPGAFSNTAIHTFAGVCSDVCHTALVPPRYVVTVTGVNDNTTTPGSGARGGAGAGVSTMGTQQTSQRPKTGNTQSAKGRQVGSSGSNIFTSLLAASDSDDDDDNNNDEEEEEEEEEEGKKNVKGAAGARGVGQQNSNANKKGKKGSTYNGPVLTKAALNDTAVAADPEIIPSVICTR